MNLEQKSEPSVVVKPLTLDDCELSSKSLSDPVEGKELQALIEQQPCIARLLLAGMYHRVVDYTGKYFVIHSHEPIE